MLNAYENDLVRLVLYGSFARGDNRPDSDVDIMLLTNCGSKERKNISKKSSDVAFDIKFTDIKFSIG